VRESKRRVIDTRRGAVSKTELQALKTKGAFPPSHFSNKLADKLAHKVASQTNVRHLCLVFQSEVCYKPNWFATNSSRQL
jgi:hypothetical protein